MVSTVSLHSNSPIAIPVQGVRVLDFEVIQAHQGPQIAIRWSYVNGDKILEAKLMRKKDDFPGSITDGVEVFSETSPTPFNKTVRISDLDVEANTFFYYRLFIKEVSSTVFEIAPTSGGRAEGKTLACDTGFFEQRMIDCLAKLYERQDQFSSQKKLSVLTDSNGTGEKFHFKEDDTIDQGELRRFIKIVSNRFDLIKCLIDNFGLYFDVDRTCNDFLPLIAALVGVEINFDIPIPQQREEIKRAVEVYKTKGTIPGTETVARNIVGLDVSLEEFAPRVLVSNRIRSFSSKFDSAIAALTMLPGDQNGYSVQTDLDTACYRFDRFALFIQLVAGVPLTQAVVEKLAREIPKFRPALTTERTIVLDVINTENFGALIESNETINENTFDEGFFCANNFLLSNDPILLSNSLTALSVRLCIKSDSFFDVITP